MDRVPEKIMLGTIPAQKMCSQPVTFLKHGMQPSHSIKTGEYADSEKLKIYIAFKSERFIF